MLNRVWRAADNARRLPLRSIAVPLDCYDDRKGDAELDSALERPYIGILFECCGVYARVYRQPDQQYYQGRCPRCLGTVRVGVGPDGVSTRIFRAS